MTPTAGPAAVQTRRGRLDARRRLRRRRLVALAAALALLLAVVFLAAFGVSGGSDATDATDAGPQQVWPVAAQSIPVPRSTAVSSTPSICDDPGVTAALEAGDDEAAIVAAGGGAAFRDAVASGAAPCVSLSDPVRRWVVVNKQRPLDPVSYVPEGLVSVEGVQSFNAGILRQDAAEALQAMAVAIEQAGVGRVAQLSGYRSYDAQVATYRQAVANSGQAEADRASARPGYSEHQTGITMDLVSCGGGCGNLDGFGGSPESQWVIENGWQFGFIVRYEEGRTDVTGYQPEPWHLRFVGPELARAYHEGGWTTLEEFFGLPAAPDYPG